VGGNRTAEDLSCGYYCEKDFLQRQPREKQTSCSINRWKKEGKEN